MNRMLAAIDNSLAAGPVLRMAQTVAPMLGARVEAIHVAGHDNGHMSHNDATALGVAVRDVNGDPVDVLTALALADDVVGVAIGARDRTGGVRELGHVALALADAADKPILIVPPESVAPAQLTRVIAAVKGTRDRSRPLRRAVEIIGQAGLDLVVVHVQGTDSIPAFSDQPQYEAAAYAAEFLARHVPGAPQARAQLRFGDPVEELLAAVREEDADILAVGWTQGSRPGRGAVARVLAAHSPVPILLVPLATVD